MGLVRYFITPLDGEWLVTLEGGPIGRYPSCADAVEAAIVMADLMGAMQHDADVMLERAPGEPLELIWTFGVDQMPRQRARSVTRPAATSDAAKVRPHVRRIQRGEAAA